jgi:hypothetical protein
LFCFHIVGVNIVVLLESMFTGPNIIANFEALGRQCKESKPVLENDSDSSGSSAINLSEAGSADVKEAEVHDSSESESETSNAGGGEEMELDKSSTPNKDSILKMLNFN